MTGRLTKKTLRGKEAFELYIKNNGDQSTFTFLADKYGLAIATIRGDISQYRNRAISPKPTDEEMYLYDAIVKRNQSLSGQKSVKMQNERKVQFNSSIIKELLELKYIKDLVAYGIDSDLSVSEILKNINNGIKYGNLQEEEILKLEKITNVINDNQDIIKDTRRKTAQEKKNLLLKEKVISEISNIIEQALIDGMDSLNELISNSEIERRTFDRYLPYLANGSNLEQTLYFHYNKEIENNYLLLEKNYLSMLNYLENGIEKNGDLTYFNLLDYFRMTKVTPSEFKRRGLELIKDQKIERRQYNVITTFFDLFDTSWRILSEAEALNYHYAVSGVAVTPEELANIVLYVQNELGLKLHTGVFQCACDEVLKGMLNVKNLTNK